MNVLGVRRHDDVLDRATCRLGKSGDVSPQSKGLAVSAFLPQMQFVIVSEVEFVDKLREL